VNRKRDLAMFDLAIDSKLRGCDLVSLSSKTSPPAVAREIEPRLSSTNPTVRFIRRSLLGVEGLVLGYWYGEIGSE
jgi:hypothetical protein